MPTGMAYSAGSICRTCGAPSGTTCSRSNRRFDALVPRPEQERHDLDHDGHVEISMRDKSLQAVVQADGDACVVEFSSYPLAHNFGDTLRHYEESYHGKLIAARAAHHGQGAAQDGIASAHDRIRFRHEIAPEDLEPDARPRGMFEDCWVAPDGTARPINHYREVAPLTLVAGQLLDHRHVK